MSSRPSASSTVTRRSTAAPTESLPKPPCKIHSLAIISEKAQITGTNIVEIGESTVLHPFSRIKADHGEVIIGSSCTICENAVVGRLDGSEDGGPSTIIGDGVNIEAGATVEAQMVGSGTSIEVNAKVGKGAVIGKHCKITPLSEIKPGEELADYTVVFGNNQRRLDMSMANNAEVREAKAKGQQMHVELLRKLIPDASAKWR
ncbi:hypothetical protein HII31_04088 [Pseudocercospora fuligena]|uniref:Dynactin subunit 6 n=1 Tax=Pseudocercospora fuligena TaxID=685502 RepID=A0A8H6RP34_9PEZI|nr:hypothetical protein HII31_04088 [Pseudocercospora fuligena]